MSIKKEMTLEEKVDKLLAFQMHEQRMSRIKLAFNVLTFVVVVVFPILGLLYITHWVKETIGLSIEEVAETFKKLKDLLDFGGIEGIKSLFKKG